MFSSFSKYFSMTGWRIGWMLVPERLRRPVDVLTGNFTICPPVLSQHAAVAAFTDASYAECDGHVARYAENRRLLLDGLPRLGIDRLAPADGAFYVYADVGHLTDDSMAFCHRLLAETGVATAPGHRLRHRGRQPVRAAVVRRHARRRSREALERLEAWLLGRPGQARRRQRAWPAPQATGSERPTVSCRTSSRHSAIVPRSRSTSRSSGSARPPPRCPETAECTIAGALRLAKLPGLPQPRAVKPAPSPGHGVRRPGRPGVRGSMYVLGSALELVEHPLAAQQADRRDALPLGRRDRQRRQRGLAGDPGVDARVVAVEPDHLAGSAAPAGGGRRRRRGR